MGICAVRPLRRSDAARRRRLSPKGRFYGCSYYKKRGASIGKNALLVEQEVLDQILLKSIEEALTEDMMKVAIEKALEKHRAGQGAQIDRRTSIERELSAPQFVVSPRGDWGMYPCRWQNWSCRFRLGVRRILRSV